MWPKGNFSLMEELCGCVGFPSVLSWVIICSDVFLSSWEPIYTYQTQARWELANLWLYNFRFALLKKKTYTLKLPKLVFQLRKVPKILVKWHLGVFTKTVQFNAFQGWHKSNWSVHTEWLTFWLRHLHSNTWARQRPSLPRTMSPEVWRRKTYTGRYTP